MGTEIISETFGEHDYARFRERLERCLSDLGELLGRPGFGVGPVTIGAELEAAWSTTQAFRCRGTRPSATWPPTRGSRSSSTATTWS